MRDFKLKYPFILHLEITIIVRFNNYFPTGWCGGGLGRVTRVLTTPALTSLGSCLFAHQLVDINGKQSTRPYYKHMDVYSNVGILRRPPGVLSSEDYLAGED